MLVIRALLIAAVVWAFGVTMPARAATYTFTGQCSDCAGTGLGTLVLTNYTEGTPLSNSNFVSFDYHSNLLSLSVDPSNLGYIAGSLGPSFPNPYNVDIWMNGTGGQSNMLFQSFSSGPWNIIDEGNTIFGDVGGNSSWNSNAVAAAPIPSALPLFAGGLGVFALLGRRRKKAAARAAA